MPLYILVWILQRWGIHFWNLRFCTAFHDWVTQVVDFFFFLGGGGGVGSVDHLLLHCMVSSDLWSLVFCFCNI